MDVLGTIEKLGAQENPPRRALIMKGDQNWQGCMYGSGEKPYKKAGQLVQRP